MKFHKTPFLILIVLSFFFPLLANGGEPEATERKKIIGSLQTPQEISRLDWMFLQWQIRLNTNSPKKVLLDEFEEKESCIFGEIRLDKDKDAIRVPIICWPNFLKHSKKKRLDVIEEWALKYLRLFDASIWSGSKSSTETLNQLRKLFTFDAIAVITDQKGNIVENIEIGSYEFGEKKQIPGRGDR